MDKLLLLLLQIMRREVAPWTCARCSDIGRKGVPMTGQAIPPAPGWPAFTVCGPCGEDLATPRYGKPGYLIIPVKILPRRRPHGA